MSLKTVRIIQDQAPGVGETAYDIVVDTVAIDAGTGDVTMVKLGHGDAGLMSLVSAASPLPISLHSGGSPIGNAAGAPLVVRLSNGTQYLATMPIDFSFYGGATVGAGNAVHVQPGTGAVWTTNISQGGNVATVAVVGTTPSLSVVIRNADGDIVSNFGPSGPTGAPFDQAFPEVGDAAGFTDGTSMRAARVFDLDSGAATEHVLGISLRGSGNGGSVELGTASNPLLVGLSSGGSPYQGATETTLAAAKSVLDSLNTKATADPATQATLEAARALLQAINTKIPASPAAEHTAANSPSSVRLSDGTNFISQLPVDLARYNGATAGAGNAVHVQPGTGATWDTELPSPAALADAAANPTTPTVGAGNLVFNGTTWDRLRGDATRGAKVQVTDAAGNQITAFPVIGNVAAASADSGAPVKIGGVYNGARPSYVSGQRGDVQLTPRGEILTTSELETSFGTISTQDLASVSGTGAGGQAIIAGNPTTGSAVQMSRAASSAGAAIILTGTWTGTLQFEVSIDGSAWTPAQAQVGRTGAYSSTATANGFFWIRHAVSFGVRVRAISAMTGSVNVTLNRSDVGGMVGIDHPLRITGDDFANAVAVKAPSTAAQATDRALVVAISPNNNIVVDTELPAAAALADGAANPTAPAVGAGNLVFNGTTWDRLRGDVANGADVDVTRLPAGTIAAAAAKTADYDSGAGTDTVVMVGLALPASGGAAAAPGDGTRGLKVQVTDGSGTQVTSFGSTQYNLDDAMSLAGRVTVIGVIRRDAGGTVAGSDGDVSVLQVDASGNLRTVRGVARLTPVALVAAGSTNTAGSTTTGSSRDHAADVAATIVARITNGTAPTTGCAVVVEVSRNGTDWRTYITFTAGTTASANYDYTITIPPAVRYSRVSFTGNTGASVTVEAYCHLEG